MGSLPIHLPLDFSPRIHPLLAPFANIIMTSSTASHPTTPTCEERTEELVRKIKALSYYSPSLKTNSRPESPSTSSSDDRSSSTSPPLSVRPATPPLDAHSSPGIEIVYSAKVHPRSPSPPPKSLARTFPCPPEIPLQNESKITSDFVRNPNAFVCGKSADANSVVDETKPLLTGDAAPLEVETNIAQRCEGRTNSRARRGRGNLWTPPRTDIPNGIVRPSTPSRQTRPVEPSPDKDGWDISDIEVKLSQISLSVFDKPEESKHEYYGSIPVWLESLPEKYESAFHLDAALDHRVSDVNHSRLQDEFTAPAFNRFNDKVRRFVRNEVDWEGLREKWN